MKTLIAFTALTLLAAPVLAHDLDGTDMEQSITNVHADHFPHADGDRHGPERSRSDAFYGSILLDLDAGESHVPHTPGDRHEAEPGVGDTYGSILNDV